MGNSSCTTCSCVGTAASFVDAGKQLYCRHGLGARVLPCTSEITCFSFLLPRKYAPPPKHRTKKGSPPGALLSGKQLTIVLAAFTAVLQMSCRHLFLLPYLLSLRLSLLLWCQSPLLCQSKSLFRLLYRRISVSHLCMWLCR